MRTRFLIGKLFLAGIIVLVSGIITSCDSTSAGTPATIFPGGYFGNGTYVAVRGTEYETLYIDLQFPHMPLLNGEGKNWDLMITSKRGSPWFQTNSGVTAFALGSGGLGGVVFSGKTVFSEEITILEAEPLFSTAAVASGMDNGEDFHYWDKTNTDSTDPTTPKTGNAISFPGFINQAERDGTTAEKAWAFGSPDPVDVDFSQATAFAAWDRMAPNFRDFTNNVYIIRSGNGSRYYKIQFPQGSVVYTGSSDSPDGNVRLTVKPLFAEIN